MLAVSNALASAASLESVLKDGLNQLMSATHSQVGAAYLRDDHLENSFRLGLALGFAPGAELPTLIAPGEEAAGLAAQRRQTVLLNELPSDTRFTFTTIAGKALPAFILNTPLIFNDQVIGVIALAGLYPLTPQRIEMVEMSRNQLAISITNALAHARTKRLAEELQVGNEELRVANEELQVQGEELRTQADRLRQQSKELEKRRKEAEVADRLKSQFLSNVSHELRTPLHSILSLSQLLIDREAGTGSPEMLESLRVIERNGRNLLNMINDVLDLAKIESGAMEIHLSEVDPHQVALKALETIRPLAAEKGLELIVDLAEVPPLYSDEERLYQILLNLLSNAVKFTEKGKVGLHVSGAEDRVAFAVSDTGIGIASNDLAKIFKEFHQIDGAPTRRYEGTGLGLAIAEKLAGMLGGEIIVDSTVGEGSTFTFALPLRWQCEIEIRPPLPSKKPTQSYSGRRQACHILVVEDNETAALQIQSTLKEEGYAVTVALGGIFAMECLQRFVPDGIILDLMMPEIDGFELLEYIRSTPAIADVPVLVLTAMDVAGTERALLHAQNVQKLIQKGAVDRGQLLDAVRRMLQG